MSYWPVLLIPVSLFALIPALLFLRVRRASNALVRVAQDLEARGQPHAACLAYALALLNNPSHPERSRQKVRQLWSEHGPFMFSERQAREVSAPTNLECDPDCYYAAVELIRVLVEGKASLE